MTLQDLRQQATKLPLPDRWQLVQILLESIQHDTQATAAPSPDVRPSDSSTEAALADLHPWTQSFVGILRSSPEGSQDAYIDYLEEKYA